MRKEHRAKIKIDYTFAATAKVNTTIHKFIFQRLRTLHSDSTKNEKNNDNDKTRKTEFNEHMKRIMQVRNKKSKRYHDIEK